MIKNRDDYAYLASPHYTLKWGMVTHLLRTYGGPGHLHIVDLGCGDPCALDFIVPALGCTNLGSYQGVEGHGPTAAALAARWASPPLRHTYFLPQDFNGQVVLARKPFNVLLWIGATGKPTEYDRILRPLLTDGAEWGTLLIVEYMAKAMPDDPATRMQGLPVRHLTGCRMTLPYVPGPLRWPDAVHRIVEAYRWEPEK